MTYIHPNILAPVLHTLKFLQLMPTGDPQVKQQKSMMSLKSIKSERLKILKLYSDGLDHLLEKKTPLGLKMKSKS